MNANRFPDKTQEGAGHRSKPLMWGHQAVFLPVR